MNCSLEGRPVHPVQGAVHRLEADHGRQQETAAEARPEGGAGYLQGQHHGGGGPQDRGQDQGHAEDGGGEDVVHAGGLGARRTQDQERGEGRGGHGGGRRRARQEGQEGGGKVIWKSSASPCSTNPVVCRVIWALLRI